MRCAEAARLPETGEQTGAVITSEMIRSYLETLSRRGRSRNTVQMYGAKLRAFYHYLPSDKRVEEAKATAKYMDDKVAHYEAILAGLTPDDTNPKNWTAENRPTHETENDQ